MPSKNWAIYVRRSTREQDDEHQEDDIRDWLDYKDIEIEEVQIYSDTGSGASDAREDFTRLVEATENGEHTDIVVWEISRIARKGTLAQRFFDSCEDAGVTIHVTNGSVRKIEPDGTGRLVADIIASVAAEERRRLISRTESGQRKARKQGKWTTRPPVGFQVDDGYLRPIIDPDYSSGETGYWDMVEAVESLRSGESYRSVASTTPNVTRQTLSSIMSDEDRKRWYLSQTSADDRVQEALDELEA